MLKGCILSRTPTIKDTCLSLKSSFCFKVDILAIHSSISIRDFWYWWLRPESLNITVKRVSSPSLILTQLYLKSILGKSWLGKPAGDPIQINVKILNKEERVKNWRGLFDCVGGGGAAVAEELARRSWVEKATTTNGNTSYATLAPLECCKLG